MERLYAAIEAKLGDTYPVFIEDMPQEETDIIGIFLYPAKSDRRDLDGTVSECIKAHIEMNVKKGADIFKALNFLRDFADKMETEESDVEGCEFIYCEYQAPKAYPMGKKDYNVQKCACNIYIEYRLY